MILFRDPNPTRYIHPVMKKKVVRINSPVPTHLEYLLYLPCINKTNQPTYPIFHRPNPVYAPFDVCFVVVEGDGWGFGCLSDVEGVGWGGGCSGWERVGRVEGWKRRRGVWGWGWG